MTTTGRLARVLTGGAVGLIALMAGAAAFRVGHRLPLAHRPPVTSLSGRARDMRYVGQRSAMSGRELVLVFVVGSTCRPSNTPMFPRTIDSLKVLLHERAKQRGSPFAVIGIAKDRDLAAGLTFLEKFGPFDEVAAGHGWGNTAAAQYVFGGMRGPAETPQVVVLERALPTGGLGRGVNERVLMRRVGLEDIRNWVSSGAPLPGL